jgi:tetratricopeptide (TPR) repeat protein
MPGRRARTTSQPGRGTSDGSDTRPAASVSAQLAASRIASSFTFTRTAIVCLALLGASLLTFANSINNPLIIDDFDTITDNQQIRQLNLDVLKPARELPVAGRPLANVTFALNYAISGQAPAPYRVTNILLHALCAMALYLVIRRGLQLPRIPPPLTARADTIAVITAMVWVVHPLNGEVVNYLTQRTESLMAIFYLLTVYCAFRSATAQGATWQVMTVVACTLGALCKETIATAPLVVLAFDRLLIFGSWKDAWARRRGLYAGLLIPILALAALQMSSPRPYSAGFNTGVSVWTYLLNQALLIARYLWLTVWPHDLVIFYGAPRQLALLDVLPQATLILSLLAMTLYAWRRWPVGAAAGIWFFLTLAPTSSILPIATEVGAERRMYLPIIAVLLIAVAGVSRLVRDGRVVVGLAAALVLALGTAAAARNRDYVNPLTLAELTLERWPVGMTRHLYAEALLKAGRRAEAIAQLRAATVDAPRAHLALGLELLADGALDEAITELQAFTRLEPMHRAVPDAESMAARALARRDRWDEAMRSAQAALEKVPGLPEAQLVVAEGYFRSERFGDSVTAYRAYLAQRPNDAEATTNLAIALVSAGQIETAIEEFRRAADLKPGDWQARHNLALALMNTGRVVESVSEARRAIALRPEAAIGHMVLGQGLAALNQREAAIVSLERAVQLAPGNEEARALLAKVRGQ